jgi:hypothetical protein
MSETMTHSVDATSTHAATFADLMDAVRSPAEEVAAAHAPSVGNGDGDGSAVVTLRCDRFAAWVHFDVPGFLADAAHFHLAPRVERSVRFVPVATRAPSFDGRVMALNGVYPGVLKPAA